MPNQLLFTSESQGVNKLGDTDLVLAAIREYMYHQKFLNTDLYAKLPGIHKAFILGVLTEETHKGSLGWDRLKHGVHEYWRVVPPTIRKKTDA